MDMLTTTQITEAGLADWRKLGQGLHARYLVDGFVAGAAFVSAVGEAGDTVGHHPRVTIGTTYVDLVLLSDDAVHRDDEGTEHVVDWVTQKDVDLARRITGIAGEHGLEADPAAVTGIELALDTARAATIAPFWAALLTGGTDAMGRGTIGDDVRDATARVPILWFQGTDETRRRGSASTSTSGSHPRWPTSGSRPPSPPVASSSTTARRRRSRCSRTRTATGRACARLSRLPRTPDAQPSSGRLGRVVRAGAPEAELVGGQQQPRHRGDREPRVRRCGPPREARRSHRPEAGIREAPAVAAERYGLSGRSASGR